MKDPLTPGKTIAQIPREPPRKKYKGDGTCSNESGFKERRRKNTTKVENIIIISRNFFSLISPQGTLTEPITKPKKNAKTYIFLYSIK